jgi:hypothetical protein
VTATLFATIAIPALMPTLRAQDAPPAPTPAAPDSAVTNLLRDPFWPVGYWPKPKAVETNSPTAMKGDDVVVEPPPPVPADPPPKWPDLRVKGTMRTSTGYVAILDGIKGVVEAGQTVRKEEGIYAYTWKINSISSAAVSHTRLDVTKIKK